MWGIHSVYNGLSQRNFFQGGFSVVTLHESAIATVPLCFVIVYSFIDCSNSMYIFNGKKRKKIEIELKLQTKKKRHKTTDIKYSETCVSQL